MGAPLTRVMFDPNRRLGRKASFTRMTRADQPVAIGEPIRLVEVESGCEADGIVTDLDFVKGLMYFDVDWPSYGTNLQDA